MRTGDTPLSDEVRKVTGRGDYVSDLVLPGMAHGKLLRSPHAHARIVEIETGAAEAEPGVIAVVTGHDLQGLDPFYGLLVRDQPLIAIDRVRHVGDPVAAVVATDERAAYSALTKIKVVYEELPAVATISAALAEDAPIVFPERHNSGDTAYDPSVAGVLEPGGNVLYRFEHGFGEIVSAFEQSAHIFADEFEFSRMSHYHLEPLVAVARAGEGEIELWSNTQDPFEIRRDIARIFRIAEKSIRIHSGLIGGGFGAKSHCKIEPLTVLLSRKARCPVRLAPGMDEAMLSLSQHSAILRLRTGVSASGDLIARDCQAWIDAGAYADASAIVASQLGYCFPGPYRWKATRVQVLAVRTNTVPAGSFRGYGRPQATWASESQVDMIARRLGLDPLGIRQQNLLSRGSDFLPDDTPVDCDLRGGLDRVAAVIDFRGPRLPGRGKGLAIGFKSAGGHGRRSEARVVHDPHGETLVESGAAEMGQGARAVAGRVAGEVLGIPLGRIRVVATDTGSTPYDDGTHACTGVAIAARAVERAARHVAEQLEAGVNRPVVVGYGVQAQTRRNGIKFGSNSLYWQPGWAAAEVEVDSGTGAIRVCKLVVAADAGKAIDLAKCNGQVFGAAMQGLGQALFECLRFEGGEPLNTSPRRYRVPLASDLPKEMLSIIFETGGGPGPFGAKGIGESGIMPIAAAIASAIEDATGARLTSLPMTPEALYRALQGVSDKRGPQAR
jgi:CO/xanthine dehydrogenase Mo-binding subunit